MYANRHSRSSALDSLMRPSITPYSQCRNLDLLSIDYAFRPHLRSRLSLGGRPFPRNPCPYGGRDSHPSYRYSCRHPHFHALHLSFRSGFSACGTLPYQKQVGRKRPICQSAASVIDLSPDHFRRIVTRPVSYYALFEGWLLLSQPPGCLCDDTSLTTESIFGDLSWRSGLFPFRLRKLALAASLPHCERMPLRSLIRVGRLVGPRALSVLYRTW